MLVLETAPRLSRGTSPHSSISTSWKDSLASFFVKRHKKVYMVSLWSIWFTRNKVVHERCRVSVREAISFVEAFLQENEVMQVASCPPTAVAHGRWQALIGDIVKFNFDAAYNAHTKESISGVICRNDNGFMCLSAYTCGRCFCGRGTFVLASISSSNTDGSVISPIVEDIKEAAKDLESVTYCFVRREANNAAHTLAREGRSLCGPTYWIEEAPPSATSAARLDKEGLDLLP
ncbi:hypothetical protein V6N12_031673 [Hibiscus sabdariffa]|uniref:RNase H type-1 domain-containing protein n=1 Tax=Hibiscus sabdariffa TaxID=183260 RepID=A0ABR2DWB2_9ROSI